MKRNQHDLQGGEVLPRFVYTVDPWPRYDTKLQKIIFPFLVRKGVWGLTFEFKGTLWGSCRELICEFKNPPLLAAAAAPAAAAVAVQAAGQTDHWLHGENDSLHVCFPQSEKQTSLIHLPSPLTLWWCLLRRAWRGCERRRLVLGAACLGAPRASSQPHP